MVQSFRNHSMKYLEGWENEKFFKKRKKNDWRFMWKCNTIYSIFYMDNKKVPIDQLIFIAIFAFIIVVDLITQIKKWLQARK